MRLKKILATVTGVVTALIVSASPASAGYSGNSWYPHPEITHDWKWGDWKCGATANWSVFSAQSCIIFRHLSGPTSGNWQAVVIVRNRSTTVRPAAVNAVIEKNGIIDEINCDWSGLAASDYSGCFGGDIRLEGFVGSVSVVAEVLDSSSGTVRELSVPKFTTSF